MKAQFFTALILCFFSIGCQKEYKEKTIEQNVISSDHETLKMSNEHNAQNSLDYYGTYEGVLPCADCEGIKVVVTLLKDQTFTQYYKYITNRFPNETTEKGVFKWNKDGNVLILEGSSFSKQYFVGENVLITLDNEGKKIEGPLADHYVLHKLDGEIKTTETTQVLQDSKKVTMADTKWKLVELYGKRIPATDKKIFYLQLDKQGKIAAYAGCNTMGGSYEMQEGNKISFKKVIATMMACPDMNVEQDFRKMLEAVDNYSLSNNKMTLNKAKMAPLAVFEVSK